MRCSQSSSQTPDVPSTVVFLWDLDRIPPLDACLLPQLDSREETRWKHARSEESGRRYLTSRALLRSVEVNLWNHRTGKPTLRKMVERPWEAERPTRLSISRSANLCAIARSLDRQVGVDVEKRARVSDTRLYADLDRCLAHLREPGRRSDPLVFWTCLEAVSKALGVPLESLGKSDYDRATRARTISTFEVRGGVVLSVARSSRSPARILDLRRRDVGTELDFALRFLSASPSATLGRTAVSLDRGDR